MSLNRYEQRLFDHINGHPEEKHHWQGKVLETARAGGDAGLAARGLERELWDYLVERIAQVPALRDLATGGLRRVSLLNLAEYQIRLWGPVPKPRGTGIRAGGL